MGATGNKSYSNEDILNAYANFTSNHYKEIRAVQNGKNITIVKRDLKTKQKITVDVTDKYKQMGNAIEFDLQNSTFNGTLYRAIGVDDATLNNYKVGQTIDQKGISSWSTSEKETSKFEGKESENTVIFVSSGKVNHAKDISTISQVDFEKEVVQSSKNKQVITNIKKVGTKTYIYVKSKK